MPDVAISWCHLNYCTEPWEIAPGDSHGPNGPRNDKFLSCIKGGLSALELFFQLLFA